MTLNSDRFSSYEYVPIREADIQDAEDYRHLKYVRGYFLTNQAPLEIGPHWRRMQLGDSTLSWDGRTPFATARLGGKQLVLIGRAFHLDLNTASLRDIATHLLRAHIAGGSAYNDALYSLAGRYVVVAHGAEGTYLQTDAAGMRTAYYARTGGTVASHAGLAAQLLRNEKASPFGVDKWFRQTNAPTHPGRHTEYTEVYMLTPNTELNVATAEIHRIGPNPISRVLTAEEAAREVVPLMQKQLAALIREGRPLMSLTAGLDTRTSLAVSFPMRRDITYFSYVAYRPGRESVSEPDMVFARDLCSDMNLDFQQVTVDGFLSQGPLSNVMKGNSLRTHSPSIAAAYREQLPADSVHIRSNIYEIGRSFFRNASSKELPELTPREFANRVIRNKQHASFEDGVAAFEDWIEAVEFGKQEDYDPYDLYYWELRMGRWLPAHQTESDIAHDTYTLVNCRRILELFLSVSLEDRLSAKVFDAIIGLTWPELFDYPVNGAMRAKPTWA